MRFWTLTLSIATLLAIAATSFSQTTIRVDYTVDFDANGTGFAPLGGVFHDGSSFSAFTPGTMASPGLEALAEGGNPSLFLSEAPASANVGNTDGQIGGSNRPTTRSFTVVVDDMNDQFSYASMFLPSNDWFIANPGGGSFDVSALLNAAAGTSISIPITSIYDAGTELEDFTRGGGTGADPFNLAPRLSDAEGGDPDDQMDNISLVPRIAGTNLFADFVNPNNEPIDRFIGASEGTLGTITLTTVSAVPEPSSISLVACAMLGLLGFRRRKR